MYEASLRCSLTLTYMPTQYEKKEHILSQQHTGIVDSGATQLSSAPTAPHGTPDTSAATIKVGTANGKVETSAAKATLHIPQLEADFLQRDTSCHPSPMSVLVKDGMMYPVVRKSAANCGICRVDFAADV